MVYTIYVHTSERSRSIIQKHKLEFFLQKTLEKTIRKLITLSMVLLFLTVSWILPYLHTFVHLR